MKICQKMSHKNRKWNKKPVTYNVIIYKVFLTAHFPTASNTRSPPGSVLSHRHSSCVTNPQFMHTLKKLLKKVILQLFLETNVEVLKLNNFVPFKYLFLVFTSQIKDKIFIPSREAVVECCHLQQSLSP